MNSALKYGPLVGIVAVFYMGETMLMGTICSLIAAAILKRKS